MNQTTTPTVIETGQLVDVVTAIWTAMLDLQVELECAPDGAVVPSARNASDSASGTDPKAPDVVGTISITGGWNGWVELRGTQSLATVVGCAMLMAEPDDLSPADVWDGWAELTNMIGGSVKSLLPEPSALSLPTVTAGGAALLPAPSAGQTTRFCCSGDTFEVRIIPAAGANGAERSRP